MIAETSTQVGRYLYAFVRTEDTRQLLEDSPLGLGNASLELISAGDITAIASATQETKVRPQRKNLAAHQAVVVWLAERCSMLPVAFGLIADDSSSVERMLVSNSDVLEEQLQRVEGRVEMSLTLRWSVENVFQYFVAQHEDLRQASQSIARGEATRDEQIEMGRQFEAMLLAEREQHTNRVLEALDGIAIETDQQPHRDEFDVLRLSCLIERTDVDRFSDAVYAVAEQFNEDFSFSFNGPWAAYSFVSLSLSVQ